MFYVILNSATGQIYANGRASGASDISLQAVDEGTIAWEVDQPYSDRDYYFPLVDGNRLPTERPELGEPDLTVIDVDGESSVAVSHGTNAYVDYALVAPDITDDIFIFASVIPGDYLIRLEPPFPYKPREYTVTVNES